MSPVGRQVALLPWGTPVEEFLDPLGLDLAAFCETMSGGWLFNYVEALAGAGWQPTLVVSSREVTRPARRVHAATGAPVAVLPAPGPVRRADPGWRRDLGAYRRCLAPGLLAELRRHDVVLVQEYEDPRTDLLALWGAVRRVPVVASFQGGAPPYEAAPVQNRLRGPAVRRLRGLLIGSEEEAARVVSERGVRPDRVHLVGNPVDARLWAPGDRSAERARLGMPDGAFVVAWHARVEVWRKGLDVLLAAWEQLCDARPDADVRLLLTGSGADDAELEVLLERPGLRGVTWLRAYAGHDAVRSRLAACDVWVSTSRHEGFAVAPAEAMASGRPVVLSDAPGAAELIGTDGAYGGVLVPRVDADAVARALLGALDGTWVPTASERGVAARQRVEQELSLEAVGARLSDALEAAAPGAARRTPFGPRLDA